MTKGLPTLLFKEFKDSLCICPCEAMTGGGGGVCELDRPLTYSSGTIGLALTESFFSWRRGRRSALAGRATVSRVVQIPASEDEYIVDPFLHFLHFP
jgi:hypothetical protein